MNYRYIVKSDEKTATVFKYAQDDERWILAAKYEIDREAGTCTCRAGKFGRTCKHIEMLTQTENGKAIPLSDARRVVQRVVDRFSEHARRVRLTADGYERNEEGLVTRINVEVIGLRGTDVLTDGVWQAADQETGALVRLHVRDSANG